MPINENAGERADHTSKTAIGANADVGDETTKKNKTDGLDKAMRRARSALDDAAIEKMAKQMAADPFARTALWIIALPGLTRRQQTVLGRIYSFQITGGEYKLSLAHGASELGISERQNLKQDLKRLLELGYAAKRSNGKIKPASYKVNITACYKAARENGWEPPTMN